MHPAALERPTVSNRKSHRPKPEKPEQEFPNVARAMRAIRKAHGLTQEDMAPILTLTYAGYRPYERGERDLTQSQIEVIATALGVPVSEITRHLWPDDPELIETRFSHEWEEIQRQTEGLPDEIRERTLRGFRESLAVLQAASDLARRN
jgi:transcriptional regulator with XRE-family HTH domain